MANAKIELRNPRRPELEAVEIEEQARLDALVASGLLAPRTSSTLADREPVTVEDVDLAGAIREERKERP